MGLLNSVTQARLAVNVERNNSETQNMLRSQQLRVAQAAQNGFISRDMQARLNVMPEELLAIQNSSMRLLGGGRRIIVQEVVTIKPGKWFSARTNEYLGRKVHIETKDDAQVHVNIIYNHKTLVDESFSGTRDFAKGLKDGYFILYMKNTSSEDVRVYVHMEDESNGCPLWR